MTFLSILFFIIGGIVYISGFSLNAEYVTQQQIQYMYYIIGTIFVIAGGIILSIKIASDNISESLERLSRTQTTSTSYSSTSTSSYNYDSNMNDNSRYSSSDTWVCKKCGTTNSLQSTSCKDCGTYK